VVLRRATGLSPVPEEQRGLLRAVVANTWKSEKASLLGIQTEKIGEVILGSSCNRCLNGLP
jgi:hypothetical protein